MASLALVLFAASTGRGQENASGIPVDLELVIAVDVSASMDIEEFVLQRSGYREAIGHPDFINVIRSGAYRRIAVAYVEWSGVRLQRIVVPWRAIDSEDSAHAFAAALGSRPVMLERGTSISAAIAFSAELLETNGYEGERRVIDISGDGPNNYGLPVAEARDDAVAKGIVINGLPILIRPSPTVPDIVEYYSDCVIGGPGSFVLPALSIEEFAASIRRKLIREVASVPLGDIIPVAANAPADCLIGERMRERYADPYFPGLDN